MADYKPIITEDILPFNLKGFAKDEEDRKLLESIILFGEENPTKEYIKNRISIISKNTEKSDIGYMIDTLKNSENLEEGLIQVGYEYSNYFLPRKKLNNYFVNDSEKYIPDSLRQYYKDKADKYSNELKNINPDKIYPDNIRRLMKTEEDVFVLKNMFNFANSGYSEKDIFNITSAIFSENDLVVKTLMKIKREELIRNGILKEKIDVDPNDILRLKNSFGIQKYLADYPEREEYILPLLEDLISKPYAGNSLKDIENMTDIDFSIFINFYRDDKGLPPFLEPEPTISVNQGASVFQQSDSSRQQLLQQQNILQNSSLPTDNISDISEAVTSGEIQFEEFPNLEDDSKNIPEPVVMLEDAPFQGPVDKRRKGKNNNSQKSKKQKQEVKQEIAKEPAVVVQPENNQPLVLEEQQQTVTSAVNENQSPPIELQPVEQQSVVDNTQQVNISPDTLQQQNSASSPLASQPPAGKDSKKQGGAPKNNATKSSNNSKTLMPSNPERTGNLKYSEFEQLLKAVFTSRPESIKDAIISVNNNSLSIQEVQGFKSIPASLHEYKDVFLDGQHYAISFDNNNHLYNLVYNNIITTTEMFDDRNAIIAQMNLASYNYKDNPELFKAYELDQRKTYYFIKGDKTDKQIESYLLEISKLKKPPYREMLFDVLRQNLYSFDIETTVNPDKSLGDITESGFFNLRTGKGSEHKGLTTSKSEYFEDLREERSFNRGVFVGQNIGFETTHLAKTYFDSLKNLYANDKLFTKGDIGTKGTAVYLRSSLEDYTGKDKFFIPLVEEKYADTLEKHLYYMVSINEQLNSRIGKSKKTELRQLVALANKYSSKYARQINSKANLEEYRNAVSQIENLLGIRYSPNVNKEEAQNFLERFNAGKIQSDKLMRFFNPLEADLAAGKGINIARNKISRIGASTHLYDEGKQGYYQKLQETNTIYQKVKRRILGTPEKVGTIMKTNTVDLMHLGAVFYNDLIQKKILKNHETIRFGTNMEVMAFLLHGEEEKHTAVSDARQQTLVARKILDFYRNSETLSEVQIKSLQSRESFIVGHRKLKTIVEKYQRIREKPVNKQVYYKIPIESKEAKPVAIKGSANILLELVKDYLTKNELESLDKDLFKFYLDVDGKKRTDLAHQESIAEAMFKIVKGRFAEMDEVLERFYSISRNDVIATPIMTLEMEKANNAIFRDFFEEFKELSKRKPDLTVEDFLKQKEATLRKYLQDAKETYKQAEVTGNYSIFGESKDTARIKGSKVLINDFFSRMNILQRQASEKILAELSDIYDQLSNFQRLSTNFNVKETEKLEEKAAILEKLSESKDTLSNVVLEERLSDSTVLKDIETLGKPFEKPYKEPPMIKPGKALMIAAAGAAAFGMLSMMNPSDQTLKENKITKSTQFARSSVEANAVVKSGLTNPKVYFGDGLWQSENMNRHYMM